MLKAILFTILVLPVFMINTHNLYAEKDSILGKWETIDDETNKPKSIIEFYKKGNMYYAKITKLLLKPQDTLCDKCEGDKKDKPVVGMTIVWNMKRDGNELSGGEILDPNNGKTYTCKIWLEKDKLKVRGYIAFLYRTQYWHRVKK